MTRLRERAVAVLAVAAAAALLPVPGHTALEPEPAPYPWTDVPPDHWAREAIDLVAAANTWMQDYGPDSFVPDTVETRRYFASAVVKAFAPDEPVDPSITFPDLQPEDPFYPYANVAVKLRWMSAPGSGFLPDRAVTPILVHKTLIRVLGLSQLAAGLNSVATVDGYPLAHRRGFGAMALGMLLGLRYNHSDEALDVGPKTPLSRAEVAWSLWRAATMPSWKAESLAPYALVQVGPLSEELRQAVEFGLAYVGYPYVWAGEWYRESPGGYCCGYQPRGGFDCSGLMWWVVKAPAGGYDNTAVRPYTGWPLAERSSKDMAAAAVQQLTYPEAQPGDLLFFDTGGKEGQVDHVNLYLGNGWALDSAGSYAGTTIVRVGEGYWQERFLWARRLVEPLPPEPPPVSP